MKKIVTPLFAVLFVLVLSSSGFGQESVRDFTYYDDGVAPPEPPIASLCQGGTPLPDSAAISICLFWDNNGNGPDATDIQPPQADTVCYGCVNFNCFTMNGEELGAGPGYFSTQVTGHALSMVWLPESPDLARYYWRISAAYNGDSSCWTSSVYTFVPGYEDIYLAATDWTCTAGPCQIAGTPPAPATNVQASDDSLCMQTFVTWDHTGENVSGFVINDETGIVGTAAGTARNFTVQVTDVLPHNYFVTATNVHGASDTSNHDNGNGYLLRFAEGPAGNIWGSDWADSTFTIHFDRPDDACGSLDSLFMVRNGVLVDFLCVDSLSDSISCTIPDLGGIDSLKLMVRAYYFARPAMETDTTDSMFSMEPLSASDRPTLIPDHFSLEQNYPNPFNPTTTIDFSIPFQSDVSIEVYNVMGQLVKTLIDGNITAGIHHIQWDGLSDGGISVSSGLYFYRMVTPGYIQTKKMLMMK